MKNVMRKLMWIISLVPLVITAVMLGILPDKVPMHHNAEGEIDRWGSKYENLIFPLFIIALTLFWQLLIRYFEKKASKTEDEKIQKEALSNANVLSVVSISMSVMYCVMQCFFLYRAYVEANANFDASVIDTAQMSCILLGVMFVVIGNFMPKTRRNGVAGLRIVWSMHNDITWAKSNRFAGASLIIVGILTIITSVFVEGMLATGLMLAYLFISLIVMLVYSYRVYKSQVK